MEREEGEGRFRAFVTVLYILASGGEASSRFCAGEFGEAPRRDWPGPSEGKKRSTNLVLDRVLVATLVAVEVVLLVDRLTAVRAFDNEVALGQPDRPGATVLGRARAPHDKSI